MEYSGVQLNDLPDEILMMIFKKMDNLAVLYSLMGVNKRINKIIHDPIFTNDLTLMICLSNNSIDPLPLPILDRFCSQILPKIHNRVRWLNLESLCMKRILRCTHYPNLYRLGLYNIEKETALRLFTVESGFTQLFKNQISSLEIETINEKKDLIENVNTDTFTQIFNVSTNLQYLKFNQCSIYYHRISFRLSSPTIFCSTLLELHVCLDDFTDCLYLLDGRFNQLQTLYVDICMIATSRLPYGNKQKLHNLKCFSLHCDMDTHVYDELIVPLLHRMSNLEKLDLYLTVCQRKTFVNGIDLKTNIINHLPQLKKFTFNIRSNISFENQIDFPSNEDIQDTFKDFKDDQIISCVDYFQEKKYSQCRIYSYPYRVKNYENITNNFPGGLFNSVRQVSLYDERPFEHEFFLRIAQSFPFLKKLTLINKKPQNNKRFRKLKKVNDDLLTIKYPHLTYLDLTDAHDDYVTQFLLDFKMCLPDNVCLFGNYKSFKRVTHNFKRDTTRINCSKANYFYDDDFLRFPQHFKDYFRYTDAII